MESNPDLIAYIAAAALHMQGWPPSITFAELLSDEDAVSSLLQGMEAIAMDFGIELPDDDALMEALESVCYGNTLAF